jgi:hypothetical protein
MRPRDNVSPVRCVMCVYPVLVAHWPLFVLLFVTLRDGVLRAALDRLTDRR